MVQVKKNHSTDRNKLKLKHPWSRICTHKTETNAHKTKISQSSINHETETSVGNTHRDEYNSSALDILSHFWTENQSESSLWMLKTVFCFLSIDRSIVDLNYCKLVKSHDSPQLKCLVTTAQVRATDVFCRYGMLTRVVFIRPFEWEQWVLLPWTLCHGSKDKREAWKEEARAAQSQTQQRQH